MTMYRHVLYGRSHEQATYRHDRRIAVHTYKYVYYCLLLIHMTSQAQTLPVHYTYTCQHYCTCLYDAYAYMPMHAYTLPIHLIPILAYTYTVHACTLPIRLRCLDMIA